MCLRKKCLDINQRLIITFMPCPRKNYVFSFQNATSSVLFAVFSNYFLLEKRDVQLKGVVVKQMASEKA